MIPQLRVQIEECLRQIPTDFGGGCTIEKALIMADYIVSEHITYSIEVGVYRGRSFFPQALAHNSRAGVLSELIHTEKTLREKRTCL